MSKQIGHQGFFRSVQLMALVGMCLLAAGCYEQASPSRNNSIPVSYTVTPPTPPPVDPG